jgi:hypothetical protein
MWIAHSEGWLSIVAHRDLPGHLLVRARAHDHITSMFPDAEVYRLDQADYHYRADIQRTVVAEILAERLEMIEYDAFKGSVSESRLHKAFVRIWEVMLNYGSRGW